MMCISKCTLRKKIPENGLQKVDVQTTKRRKNVMIAVEIVYYEDTFTKKYTCTAFLIEKESNV